MEEMERKREDRSLGRLFGDLSREVLSLVRQEVEFAKAEMSDKANRAGKDVTLLVIGGGVSFSGLLALLAGVIALGARYVPMWLSAVATGVVVGSIGLILVWLGRRKLRKDTLAPNETIEAYKEDKEWLKSQLS